MLWLVLGYEKSGTPMSRVPHAPSYGRENMVRRSIVNVLGGVQA
jgi:hypothetical protein